MDPSEGSWLDEALAIEEAEFGFEQLLTSDMPYDWVAMGPDNPDLTSAASVNNSFVDVAKASEREDEDRPIITCDKVTEDSEKNRTHAGLTSSQASLGAFLPQVNYATSVNLIPTASGREAASIDDSDNNAIRSFAVADRQNMSAGYCIPRDDLEYPFQPLPLAAGCTSPGEAFGSAHSKSEDLDSHGGSDHAKATSTSPRAIANSNSQSFAPSAGQDNGTSNYFKVPADDTNKQKCLTMLVYAFKRLKHTEGREDEVEWVQEQTDSKINRWCHETLEAIITRQSSGKPLCTTPRKRNTLKSKSEYPSFNARLKAVFEVLKTEKRACKRFQRDPGWAKRLADDPVFEQAAIISNDDGNTARAIRDRQKKENDVAMLEGWKRVLAGEVLTKAEVMHFVNLAEYNTKIQPKGRHTTTPSTRRQGRARELNPLDSQVDSGEFTSMTGSLAETSPYVGHDSHTSVHGAFSEDMEPPTSTKKRKVDECRGPAPVAPTAHTRPIEPESGYHDGGVPLPPRVDGELSCGRLSSQQIANAAAHNMTAEFYVNYVRRQYGVPEIDWYAD